MPINRPALGVLATLLAVAGCQTSPTPDRATVAEQLSLRFATAQAGAVALPPGAALDHPLTEDEAIGIALWNNNAFQEQLVDLGVARADLIAAGLLPNPEFLYYFPASDKPFKYLFDFPIEAIWLRPIRLQTARHEVERTAERLTQLGLDLIRDVRQAYADVVLARERVRVADESVTLRGRVSELAEIRLRAGDISPQEAATARIDALQAKQDAARIAYEVPIAEERLRFLLGVGMCRTPLTLDPAAIPACRPFDTGALVKDALGSRPDALAAVEAVESAEARLKFARLGWVRFLGVLDATSGRNTGHEFSPALRFTLPVFNQNQGGVARAEAELERALRNRQTVAAQIILDVQRSHDQYQQTCAELTALRTQVRPEVEAAIRRAQGAYQEGNVTIFIVLETTRQLIDSHLREAVLTGDLRRQWAELERNVGKRLAPSPGREGAAP